MPIITLIAATDLDSLYAKHKVFKKKESDLRVKTAKAFNKWSSLRIKVEVAEGKGLDTSKLEAESKQALKEHQTLKRLHYKVLDELSGIASRIKKAEK